MSSLGSPAFLKKLSERYKAPDEIDMSKPSIARVYSYYLGGKDHFEADRDMANYAEDVVPGVTDLAMANRAFVQRAVRHMADLGIHQFLDVGSGLPTDGNVHQIAKETTPDARVVYVDHDPMVLTHARALLADSATCMVISEDLTNPRKIINAEGTRYLLDLKRPVGLILGGILHHLHNSQNPQRHTRELCDALAPGSHLAISHFCRPDPADHPTDAERAERLQQAFLEKLNTGLWRRHDEILAYFCGWEMLPPGLVPLDEWHPLPTGSTSAGSYRMPPRNRNLIVGGVARKP
ncbi:SAM-dependent methyltransferase [Halostreptopolyspora alba]|uniref:SAM-dependent methyltransferase n=1 Tax=Halostreptopolyspora alba TaxID=2487137 RepID=A0A3N0EE46_9ACTN|nr:SAM-dependent methyltransferase [Nocardiopsaceae bacterium YIM 96095]